MRVVVARHGNTFWPDEVPRRIGARTDLPLVASGRAQALALRDRFDVLGWHFARVMAGPLLRTIETARLAFGREPEIASWLAEIDHGPDEGRPEPEVVARVGRDALDQWDRDGVPPPGWRVDAEERTAAWRDLLAIGDGEGDDGDTLLVTSNGAARYALAALGVVPAAGLKLRTGAYGVIEDATLKAWDVRP